MDRDELAFAGAAGPPVQAAEWEGMSAGRALLGMAAVYRFTGVWNITGQPAISVPAPPTRDGPSGRRAAPARPDRRRLLA